MNPLALFKPEYLFRPSQLARRCRLALLPPTNPRVLVPLSFGGSIEVSTEDAIGQSLLHLGVYDLAVSELVVRLASPGEVVMDIGANIGYFTRLFGAVVGAGGRVIAFEAHPVLFDELCKNVDRQPERDRPNYELRHQAVSSTDGVVQLAVPHGFATNRGLCHVVDVTDTVTHLTVIRVPAVRLDDTIDSAAQVGVVKMDVEGHETSVLAGAGRILRSMQVRDWVFEDLSGHSDVALTFESHGYEVFLIERKLTGPRLANMNSIDLTGRWEPPSFLATADASRARHLCERAGWRALRRR